MKEARHNKSHILWIHFYDLCCCCWVAKLCLIFWGTPWTVAHQGPLSMGFPRQEHWSGLLFPSPGDLPDPGIEPASPALAGGFFTAQAPGKPFPMNTYCLFWSSFVLRSIKQPRCFFLLIPWRSNFGDLSWYRLGFMGTFYELILW